MEKGTIIDKTKTTQELLFKMHYMRKIRTGNVFIRFLDYAMFEIEFKNDNLLELSNAKIIFKDFGDNKIYRAFHKDLKKISGVLNKYDN